MVSQRAVSDRRELIRSFFLQPVESYSVREAAEIAGVPVSTLRREIRAGDRDAIRSGRFWRLAWRQVAYVALDVWTLAEIHDALGVDAASVLPPLLALRTVTVCLPEYIVRALETTAAENGITLDERLKYELIDFAGTMAEQMEAVAPGYRRAYFYPGQP